MHLQNSCFTHFFWSIHHYSVSLNVAKWWFIKRSMVKLDAPLWGCVWHSAAWGPEETVKTRQPVAGALRSLSLSLSGDTICCCLSPASLALVHFLLFSEKSELLCVTTSEVEWSRQQNPANWTWCWVHWGETRIRVIFFLSFNMPFTLERREIQPWERPQHEEKLIGNSEELLIFIH